ncbi:MAG: hypothetical protein LAO31_17650 [Acidobacteriia bacterium]|nr:hypothetical protein [Terriglobia bacterium]
MKIKANNRPGKTIRSIPQKRSFAYRLFALAMFLLIPTLGAANTFEIPVLRNDATAKVGLALTNSGSSAAEVQLRGYSRDPGSSGSARFTVTVSTSVTIPALAQVSKFLSEYDPRFEGFAGGWVEVSSPSPDVHAMFLNTPTNILAFAGSSDPTCSATQFTLPESRVDPVGNFEFTLINDNPVRANVTLSFVDTAFYEFDKSVTLEPQEMLDSSVMNFFPKLGDFPGVPLVNGYMTVQSSQPLSAFQQISNSRLLVGQSPPPMNQGATRLFMPQFVVGPDWFTELSLVNPSLVPLEVTVSLLDEQGNLVVNGVQTNPQRILVPNQGQVVGQGTVLFGISGPGLVVGSLEISSPGGPVMGSAVIGDNAQHRFATAVPVAAQTYSEAVFAQVASGDAGGVGYWTGLAFQNPNSTAATVQIQVYSPTGSLTGQGSVTVAAGGRISQQLIELIPGFSPQIGGHIHVISSIPLTMLEIFGNGRLDFLTTVTASVIR